MSFGIIRSKRALRAAVCVAVLSLFAAGAQAKEEHIQKSKIVKYGDLDLSKRQDAKALYSRLRAASNAVCGWYDARDPHSRASQRVCYQAALEDAVAQVDHSVITELHASIERLHVASSQR